VKIKNYGIPEFVIVWLTDGLLRFRTTLLPPCLGSSALKMEAVDF
jgi:hypothetical protein